MPLDSLDVVPLPPAGNYVLQTALSVADGPQALEIESAITPHLAKLRENVRLKWKKMLKKHLSRTG